MRKKLIVLLVITFFITSLINLKSLIAAEEVFHGGDIVYTEPVKAVLFSHKNHVEDIGIDCDACHNEIFEMESLAAQGNKDFTMKALYEGKYCGACHDASMAFSSKSQCARCHIGVKGYNTRKENTSKDIENSDK